MFFCLTRLISFALPIFAQILDPETINLAAATERHKDTIDKQTQLKQQHTNHKQHVLRSVHKYFQKKLLHQKI